MRRKQKIVHISFDPLDSARLLLHDNSCIVFVNLNKVWRMRILLSCLIWSGCCVVCLDYFLTVFFPLPSVAAAFGSWKRGGGGSSSGGCGSSGGGSVCPA
jgi:uncharacterized membrane protein YgcG